jgi:hypothetical protein
MKAVLSSLTLSFSLFFVDKARARLELWKLVEIIKIAEQMFSSSVSFPLQKIGWKVLKNWKYGGRSLIVEGNLMETKLQYHIIWIWSSVILQTILQFDFDGFSECELWIYVYVALWYQWFCLSELGIALHLLLQDWGSGYLCMVLVFIPMLFLVKKLWKIRLMILVI